MNGSLVALGLILAIGLLITSALLVYAISRVADLARRVALQERRIAELERTSARAMADAPRTQPTTPIASSKPVASSRTEEAPRGAPIAPIASRPASTERAAPETSAPFAGAPGTPAVPSATHAERTPGHAAETPLDSRHAPTTARPPAEHASRPPRPHATTNEQSPSFERWVGVTGAAIVGAVVLAIAGFFLVQYSVQRGLLAPAVRIALAFGGAAASTVAAAVVRRRGYTITANALTGAGAVMAFAAAWAAHTLYALWPFALAFACMVAITAWCAYASTRHRSQTIAVLGLLGGFATPLVLSTNADRPAGLFTYVLLLDLGFLFVAHRRRWPALALLGILGTTAIQTAWLLGRMRPAWEAFGLGMVAVFALVFVGFVALQPRDDRVRWVLTQIAALLLAFVLALRFATSAQHVGQHVYPIAAFSALLGAAACWIDRRERGGGMALGAAAGTLALFLAWTLAVRIDTPRAWEIAISSAAVVAAFHVASTWKLGRDGDARELGVRAFASPTLLLAFGLLASSALDAHLDGDGVPLAPWIAAWTLLALFVARRAATARVPWAASIAPAIMGIGLAAWCGENGYVVDHATTEPIPDVLPRAGTFTLLVAAISAMFWLVARAIRDEGVREDAWRGAAFFSLSGFVCLGTAARLASGPGWYLVAMSAAFGALAAIGALGARSGIGYAGALAFAALGEGFRFREITAARSISDVWIAVSVVLLAALVFTALPFATRQVDRRTSGTWRAAALAAPIGFAIALPLRDRVDTWFLPGAIAFVFALLALVAWRTASARAGAAPDASSVGVARTAFAASALALFALVVPLHVDHDWPYVGASFIAATWAVLRLRTDRPWLGIAAVALALLATAGLILPRMAPGHATHAHALWNPLAWSYLAPSVALAAAGRSLARERDDVARFLALRADTVKWKLGPAACALSAIVLVFAWINLAILNAFGSEPRLAPTADRLPARDLTISIAWALYALALLVIGVKRASTALRWVSLALFLATIGKVFLLDLGELEGLHRVASLTGLAMALLVVSMLYQRFVFRRGVGTT